MMAQGGLVDLPGYYQDGGDLVQARSQQQQSGLVPLPRPHPGRQAAQDAVNEAIGAFSGWGNALATQQPPQRTTPTPDFSGYGMGRYQQGGLADPRTYPPDPESNPRLDTPPPRPLPEGDEGEGEGGFQGWRQPYPPWWRPRGGEPFPRYHYERRALGGEADLPGTDQSPGIDQRNIPPPAQVPLPRPAPPTPDPGPARDFPSRDQLRQWERKQYYRQRGGGLGIPQMNQEFKEAHYSGTNMRAALSKPPGIHLINSSVPGRTDRIPMRAHTGSYILPADVVSGLGQGNTNAGAKAWGQMISHSIGPMGIQNAIKARTFKPAPMPSMARSMGRPAGGGAKSMFGAFADGGAIDDDGYTPIITAGGEVVIDPEIVEELGRVTGGDAETGKKLLADSVTQVRKDTIKHMRSLPAPVK